MGKNRLHAFFASLCCMLFVFATNAQNNLSTSFTPPDFLNICGDPDEGSVTISVNGIATTDRSNLQATANLFKGVVFESLNAGATSAGVTLVDASNPNQPVFSLPDLSPTGTSSVDIVFSVRANCEYTDTLAANDQLEAFDTWTYTYDMGANTNLTETDGTIANSYRNSFAVPFITMTVPPMIGPQRVNDCVTRTIIASNSGLDGFLDTLVYENIQEAGVIINEIQVNGNPIPITKVANANGDTIVTAIIEGSFFNGNTIGGNPGDGDAFMDKDESVTIVENLCIISCDEGSQSTHSVSWGCDGRYCDTDTRSSLVRIGDGAANASIAESVTTTSVNVGYCQPGTRAFTVSNEGVDVDAGFGAMMNLELGIVFGADVLVEGNFTMTSVQIAGINIPTPQPYNALDNNPAFNVDPDGAGGLADIDGDGFFDDLPVGTSVEIVATYEFSCTETQEVDDNCTNNFNATIKARARHNNACDVESTFPYVAQSGPANSNSSFENCSSPDAFLDVDTFYINHMEDRQIRFFDRNCGGNDVFNIRVVLPTGVNLLTDATQFSFNDQSSPLTLNGTSTSGDTLILEYDASGLPELDGTFFLDLGFKADCSAMPGPTEFHTEIEYYCPGCDCRHLWYCDDIVGPQLHASNPPCLPAVVPDCNVGIQTTDFDANRTTLGFADPNYTTPIDPADANTKLAMSCDTIEMQVLNVVGNTPLTDSVGIVITYSNPDRTNTPDEIFTFERAVVRIKQGATENYCYLTPADTTLTIQDSLKTIRFDLNDCITNLGLTLNAGDTLEFLGYFLVDPDGPYSFEFEKVPDLRGYGFATVDGVEYACDNFGDVIEIAKNSTNFDFPRSSGTSNLFPRGCAETFLDYRLVSTIDGIAANFPDEYRAALSVDSIKFTFDPAVLNGFQVFEPFVAIPGHPIHGNDFFPMPPFSDFPDGNYVATFDTLTYKPSFNVSNPYPFVFRIRAIPDCNSPNASSNGDHVYDFDPEIYFTDNYFARAYGDGSCAKDSVVTRDNDIIYSAAPTFTFNAQSNTNYNLLADTAEWVVQHCNTAFNADAGVTWLAIDNPGGGIEVISVEDISDPNNPVALTFNSYGTDGENTFAFAPELLRSDGLNTLSDYCNTLRVRALVNQCGTTNLNARVGWNCIPYTDPAWNPEDYPPCTDMVIPLSVTTQDPFLDAVITDVPAANADLCDTAWVTILVENTDVGAAFDIQSQLIIPLEGSSFVPGSVSIAYPSGGTFVPATADPVPSGTNQRGQVFQYDDFSNLNSFLDQNGLPGFNNVNPSDSNEFKIRFGFTTDCDFRSGSIAYYSFQGLKGCQDSTNVDAGESQPIFLNGAEPDPTKSFAVTFGGSPIINSGGTSTIEVQATNLTTTATDAGDLISVKIPNNVNYVLGSSVAITPGSWVVGDPTAEVLGNMTQLTWLMPLGLLQNDQAIFQFDLSAPTLSCADSDVELSLATITSRFVRCEVANLDCKIDIISSVNGESIVPIPVGQSLLSYNAASVTSACLSATEESVTVDGVIINSNLPLAAGSFVVRYYFDTDDNGVYDVTDPEIANFTESGPLTANQNVTFSHNFAANTNQVCAIIARIDSTGLGLCDATELLLPATQLLNAGLDTVVCATAPITINFDLGDPNCAAVAGYTYNWTAIAPANVADLSATNVHAPTLNVNHPANVQDTLRYILATTRPSCSSVTRDTISIVRGIGVTVDGGSTVLVESGNSVTLMPTISGGVGPFTYSWSPATGLNDPTIANPIATPNADTDYTLTVSTAVGCSASAIVEVRLGSGCLPPEVNSVTITEPNCGESTGTAMINLTGNESNYSYQWSPNVGVANADGNGRTGLSFGGYSVVIVDNSDASCSTQIDFLVENANGPSASIDNTTPATCASADGGATLLPAAFNYAWSDGGSGASRSDLAVGIYFVTFSDPGAPTCENVLQVEIDEINLLAATVQVNTYPQCGMSDGSVTLNVTGGSGNYNYSWSSGTDTETGLAGGTYTVTVSEIGGDGCELEVVFTLRNDSELSAISLSANEVTLACGGDTNGTVDFTVNYDVAFVGPADTIISNGVDQFENGTLTPGNYCIYIEDANNCITGEACFSITAPDSLYLIVVKTDACGLGGDISLEAVGGTGPYNFDWVDIAGVDNTPTRNGLTDGSFDVVLTDQNGCPINESVTIDACGCDPAELVSVSIIEPTCGNSDGSAIIKLTQDESNYSYTWSPDLGTANGMGNMRGELPFGNYQVTISHAGATDCETVIDFNVENADGPMATVDSVGTATCTTADGFARLLPATHTYNWSDGGSGAQRSDLTAGTYLVTFNDPADASCQNIVEVEIPEFNPLEATVQVNTNPACGAADGSVTLIVTGGSGTYNYSWASGTDTQTGLAAGPINVTITDTAGDGCVLDFNFVLTNIETSPISLASDTVQISCPGFADGMLNFTVNYDIAFNAPADTIITDENGTEVQNGTLAPGNYCIRIEDNGGCVTGGECFTVVEPNPIYFVFVMETACNDMGSIEVTVEGGTAPFTYDWADVVGTDDAPNRNNLPEGDYNLNVIDANGCSLTDDLVNVPACGEECDYFFGQDTVMTEACSGLGQLCFDINLPDTSLYNITVDGSAYTGGYGSCFTTIIAYNYSELFGSGLLGPYEVNDWTVDDSTFTGAFEDVFALVDSMNTWDTTGLWVIDQSNFVIVGGDDDKTYGAIRATQTDIGSTSTLNTNSQIIPEGVYLELPEGEYNIEITNLATGCTDGVLGQVICGGVEDIVDTIFITETVNYCIDTTELTLVAEVATITNVCPELSGEEVEFTIDEVNLCIDYEGVRLGTDTACIEICDVLGNCDTINFFITVINLPPEVVVDTIFVNETVEYCLDTTIFSSPITTFENFCEDESTGFVDFFLNDETYCVEYTGLEFGQKDTACVVLCDSLGFCDTTFFCIFVEEYLDPPIAVDDNDTTSIGTPVVIDIKANDITFGGIDTAYIITEPEYGTATLNPDCSITYNAGDEFCEREDVLTYVICNPNGCDTADVFIFIECIDIFIFNAVSPNRDGTNDVFYIANIEDYPDSELFIYNRWGTLVYNTIGYNNDWRGTYNNKRDLPDGVYYYVLDLNDDDERKFNGYIELHR